MSDLFRNSTGFLAAHLIVYNIQGKINLAIFYVAFIFDHLRESLDIFFLF